MDHCVAWGLYRVSGGYRGESWPPEPPPPTSPGSATALGSLSAYRVLSHCYTTQGIRLPNLYYTWLNAVNLIGQKVWITYIGSYPTLLIASGYQHRNYTKLRPSKIASYLPSECWHSYLPVRVPAHLHAPPMQLEVPGKVLSSLLVASYVASAMASRLDMVEFVSYTTEKCRICALVTHSFAGFLPRLRLRENHEFVGYICTSSSWCNLY